MALKLYISNDIEKLARKLADTIKYNPIELFQKEYIIVQTSGMSRWISIKTTENNTIFSNFSFLSPNNLFFELFRLAGVYNSNLYDTNSLKWIIFDLLGSSEFKNQFHRTYSYFKNDRIKQLQLATKLSDLFDQYVIYRPDYIRNWNLDEDINVKKSLVYHEKWQRWIWNEIKTKLGHDAVDKVQMRDELLEKFNSDQNFVDAVKKKFPRISLFGFSIFTMFHIEVFLNSLKEIVDVDFYLFNPAPEQFWFHDIKEKTKVKVERFEGKSAEEMKLMVGNQLLMNQGKTAKNLFLMLFKNDDFINIMDNSSLLNPPSKKSLLTTIQNEIYHNISNEERNNIPIDVLKDGSVNISSNYSALREVETLYSYLLKQIEENNYQLKDVIVQTSNIDIYTPLIKAVFDNASIKIPYTIADRSYAGNDNLVSILKQLLSIQKDEFTSEDILQLLEYDIIRNKFEISNIKAIRTLVKMANIRQGVEGDIENDTIYVSWKYGLERIILGYAIYDDSLYQPPNLEYSIKPLEMVEGEYAKEGIKLKWFVDTLTDFINSRNKPRKLLEWQEYVFDFMSNIWEISDDRANELNYIFNKLTFSDIVIETIDENISYDVFYKAFIDSLYSENRSGNFISGVVTFCSMIPMRSIPYKVIAILGLNSGSFPRRVSEISFDLMLSERRPEDRNIKETDKYLFFETLLSAKEKLYLSYVGSNIKNNSENPPSIVIDELLDYVDAKTDFDVRDILVTKHSLDNFNNKYYQNSDYKYYTYLKYGSIGHSDISKEIPEEQIVLDKNIRLVDLEAFYQNPIKWFYNKKLNIYFDEEEILLPETEKFELNNLEKSILKRELLDTGNIDSYTENLKYKIIDGELPLKNMATFEVKKTFDEIDDLLSEFNKEKEGEPEQIYKVEVEVGEHTISGEINNVFGNKLIILNTGKDVAKALLKLQIKRWISTKANLPIDKYILINTDDGKVKRTILDKKVPDDSDSKLNNLLKFFKEGLRSILPFNPLANYNYLKKYTGKKRGAKTPFEVLMKTLENKAEYDLSIKKAIEEGIFNNYKNVEEKDNLILELAQLCFNNII